MPSSRTATRTPAGFHRRRRPIRRRRNLAGCGNAKRSRASCPAARKRRPACPEGSGAQAGPARSCRGPSALESRRARTRLLLVRWLIDGMNVIGTRPDAWWRDRHAAMVRLVDLLERWAAANGAEVTVVFEKPPSPPIRSTVIEIAHAPRPRRDSADDEIVRMLHADAEPSGIRVVTSD